MNSTASKEAKQTNLPPLASLEEFIARTAGQNRFLVLDCYDGNFFGRALDYFEVDESALFRMPVHTVEGSSKDPLLVYLSNEYERAEMLMQAHLEQAMKRADRSPRGSRNNSALISSSFKPEHVAKHIARAGRYRMRNQPKSAAFRFFDPRVMHTLQRLFSPMQAAMLLGPVTYWGYVDFRSQFRLAQNTSPRQSSSVVIRDEQIGVLRRNATVQTALRRLQKLRADWPEDLDAVLDGLIQRAPKELHEASIVHREDDLASYAALCWLCDTGRADRKFIEQAMKEHHDSGAPLEAVLESLLPQFFE